MTAATPYRSRYFDRLLRAPFILFACLAITSCSHARHGPQDFAGKAVYVPEFTIAVKLSDKAEKRLKSLNESVLVIAYFDGDALPGQGKYNAPFRDVFLGSDEKLVDSRNMARFDRIRVPLKKWNRLSDKNYFVTINTVSARKATNDNLLDCDDPMDRRIEALRGKTVDVQCRLIGEQDALTK